MAGKRPLMWCEIEVLDSEHVVTLIVEWRKNGSAVFKSQREHCLE